MANPAERWIRPGCGLYGEVFSVRIEDQVGHRHGDAGKGETEHAEKCEPENSDRTLRQIVEYQGHCDPQHGRSRAKAVTNRIKPRRSVLFLVQDKRSA